MSPLRIGLFAWLGCLVTLVGWAGEIIIIEKTPLGDSRSERGAGYAQDEARRQIGKTSVNEGVNIIITDDEAQGRAPSKAEQASREAREYLSPPVSGAPVAGDGTTVILRAVPLTEAERSRMKARSYVTPSVASKTTKQGSTATNQVGTIGDGPNAERGSVVERGTSSVNSR